MKGERQTLYFAVMLKSLRNTGDFLNKNSSLSDKIRHYLCKQLNISEIPLTPVSRNSQTTYAQIIKGYLGYREYTASEETLLKDYILCEMQKELFSIDSLKSKSYEFLKAHKVMRPPATVFDRAISSYRKKAYELLYEKLANKLTPKQNKQMLAMLKRQPNLLSQVNYYKKSPPEPTAAKINVFIKRFNELNQLGITRIDFSDISELVFNQLELLGRTYDANALNQLRHKDKKVALLLCALVSASQNILDHILDMNDKLLAKKERVSKNMYHKTLKAINRQAKKGLKFLVNTTKQWWNHNDLKNVTLFDFKKTVNKKRMTEAMTSCEQLSDYQEKGYYEILERKYSDLRKYTVNLFELGFKGAKGKESLIKSIEILRKLNNDKSNALPEDAPTDFVPKIWRKAIHKNKKISRRTWEMALYYEVKSEILS